MVRSQESGARYNNFFSGLFRFIIEDLGRKSVSCDI
jgi:hypothetical protein